MGPWGARGDERCEEMGEGDCEGPPNQKDRDPGFSLTSVLNGLRRGHDLPGNQRGCTDILRVLGAWGDC